jgi:hypothetical protein
MSGGAESAFHTDSKTEGGACAQQTPAGRLEGRH